MLIESKTVKDKILEGKYFYLNQGRYGKAEAFSEALKIINSLERNEHEDTSRLFTEPSKG